MSPRILALGLLFALTLTACDSADEYTIGGTYAATETVEDEELFPDGGIPVTLTLTIPEVVSGRTFSFRSSYSAEIDGETVDFGRDRGTGTYDHPDVSLDVDGDVARGTASADGDQITLSYEDTSFVLQRQ